ncbi:hypothetical protein JQ625_27900 [Bradyrhizobium diazoefficiens]|nr:hypothetical protein [Bradyrhizobium diazoefficiens]MBR0778670.1 hypothetical protein [Bradyrhizobium diazoefficiens]
MRCKGVVLCLGLMCTPASADTIRGALNDFGLIGSWSPDCGKDVEKEAASRFIYAVPLVDAATLTAKNRFANNRTTFSKFEIESATRLTDQKIRLAINPVEVKVDSVDKPREGIFGSRFIVTLEKVGSKIRTIEYRSPDGEFVTVEDGQFKNGTSTPLLEKCLN